VGSGLVESAADGNNIQNFLICVEMLPAAVCMMFAFPWREYASAGTGLSGDTVGHAMSLRDLVSDTVHQFAPTYQNYVLYSDGVNKGGRLSGEAWGLGVEVKLMGSMCSAAAKRHVLGLYIAPSAAHQA